MIEAENQLQLKVSRNQTSIKGNASLEDSPEVETV
jgi:hypothetical protein